MDWLGCLGVQLHKIDMLFFFAFRKCFFVVARRNVTKTSETKYEKLELKIFSKLCASGTWNSHTERGFKVGFVGSAPFTALFGLEPFRLDFVIIFSLRSAAVEVVGGTALWRFILMAR